MASLVWIAFIAVVVGMLALDLGVFHKKESVPTIKSALGWTSFYVSFSLLFSVLVYYLYGENWFGFGTQPGSPDAGEAVKQYLAGYLVEQSLSADNIFVIAMIFAYFRVPGEYQHRVLFWGILGAIVLRGIMIGIGAALVQRFDWITYVFGTILLITAIRLLLASEDKFDPESHFLVRLLRRFYPVSSKFDGHNFLTMENGRRAATPLLVTLVVVEGSDVLFAVDSIPAIFSVTKEPFLVFTSNVFAILGLRSLYFALAGMMEKFAMLKTALVFLLAFIGVKMLMEHHFHIPTSVSLAVIAAILGIGVVVSVISAARDKPTVPALEPPPPEAEAPPPAAARASAPPYEPPEPR